MAYLRTLLTLVAVTCVLQGCGGRFFLTPAAEREYIYDEIKAYQETLNRRFKSGELNHRQVTELRSENTKRLSSASSCCRMDAYDLEYHQFKILLASQLDAKKITIEQAKYLDIKKANELKERAGPSWFLLW